LELSARDAFRRLRLNSKNMDDDWDARQPMRVPRTAQRLLGGTVHHGAKNKCANTRLNDPRGRAPRNSGASWPREAENGRSSEDTEAFRKR
jgi:hypothetical protein